MTRPPYTIPDEELSFRASRASGPGGQHVNKTASRIEVTWDVLGSPSLGDAARARLAERLASRIDKRGRITVAASDERSQARNRELAAERLRAMVAKALAPRKKRVATRPSRASKAHRLEAKRRLGAKKQGRATPSD